MTDDNRLSAALERGGQDGIAAATQVFAKTVTEHPARAIAVAAMLLALADEPAPATAPELPEKLAYKLGEAAALVGLSRDKLREEMFQGRLAAVSAGPRATLIAHTELIRWLGALPAWTP